MNEPSLNYHKFFLLSIAVLCIVFLVFITSIFDKNTKIIFCDVGQGDGAYIRVNNRVDLLIDTGPDQKILECLGKYMPFYDKKIEIIIITHPQKDHIGGLKYIKKHYKVSKIFSVNNQSPELLVNKEIISYPISQNKIHILDKTINFYWPLNNLPISIDNDDCLIFSYIDNNFTVLFTADASARLLLQIIKSNQKYLNNVDILKTPHHGSKNGLNNTILQLANPKVAVISVGENNQYGHPNPQILDLFKAKNIIIKRTDKDGDVVFKITNDKIQIHK